MPTPTRNGYKFSGWYTSSSGGTRIEENTEVSNTSGHTLYAHWKATVYAIQLDPNGDNVDTFVKSHVVTYGKTYGYSESLPNPTRTGYKFLGWFTAANGGEQVKSSTAVDKTSEHTLYAHWKANEYTINFVPNGGVVSKESMVVTYDSTYGNDLPIPTKEGYVFKEWNTKANGSGTSINSSTTVKITTNTILFALWEEDTTTTIIVKFDSNGGGVPSKSEMTVTLGSLYGTLPTVSREGYSFLGWFTEKDGGTQVTNDTEVTATSNHTLYARWAVDTSTITINFVRNSDGDAVEGFLENKTVLEGGTYGALPILTRLGYDFDGWWTSSTGGEKITGTTSVKDNVHYLYAHWIKKEISIHLIRNSDGDDVVGLDNLKIVLNGESTYRDLPILTRINYNFKGWYTSTDGSKEVSNGDKIYKNESHYLYAIWEKKSTTTTTYTIGYNANGGKGAPSNQTKTKGKDLTLRTGVPTRDGYEFLGWSTSSKATSATYQSGGTYSINASTTLYAVWVADEYTITYNANGGTGTMSNSNYTYGVAKALSDNTFIKEGSTFKCWNTNADGTGINYADKQSVTISEDLTLYAQWKSNDSSDDDSGDIGEDEITYIVRYNANGGTGTMKDEEHLYNFAKSLSKNIFTRIGYKFNGWNTKADGTGKSYADEATVSNLSSTKGAVVTLYAQWVLDVISGDDGETGDSGTGSGENNEYPTVNLTLDKAYDTKLDLAVNVGNITDSDNAFVEIYLIPMEGTGFETGSSYVINTIKNCKNGKNIATITDLKPDTKYTFQVVLLTEKGSLLGEEYVTFKTEPKKSIIENITESPQTGMLATILVGLICICSLGGLMYYRKKVNNNI